MNGQTASGPEQKIDPGQDEVCLEGRRVSGRTPSYYLLNKPAGVVSATEDKLHQTVLDLLSGVPNRQELFPVGRLDRDTTGLLLITDDGPLAHELLSPRKHVEKTYYARVDGRVSEADVEAFAAGMDIGEKRPTLPAKLHILHAGEVSEVELTISEGKFHQVKRMMAKVGKPVLYLRRTGFGPLTLDPGLAEGEYRKLTEEEIIRLKNR